jgi:hypothetical protein
LFDEAFFTNTIKKGKEESHRYYKAKENQRKIDEENKRLMDIQVR